MSHSVNLNTATDAIGNIRRRGGGENLVAFSTLDGELKAFKTRFINAGVICHSFSYLQAILGPWGFKC